MNSSDDWTGGPAKWAAVIVLGAASIAGMTWSIAARQPRAVLTEAAVHREPAPAQREPAPVLEDGDEAVAAAPEPLPVSPRAPDHPAAARKVNINTATSAELELLPGIGPALAGRIVAYRTESGPFRSVDQLDEVKGIGARTLERLRPLVRVE